MSVADSTRGFET